MADGGVVCVNPYITLAKVSVLECKAQVCYERERINGRVRGRVLKVQGIGITEARTDTAHGPGNAGGLIRQQTQSISGIW